VRCDGVEIPYDGRLVKRGEPQSDDYILLQANSSALNEFDLASLYSLVPCDECRVSFRGRIHDIATNKNDVPRASSEHGDIQITGNDVVFSILPKSKHN
jgi:hypothetical protein